MAPAATSVMQVVPPAGPTAPDTAVNPPVLRQNLPDTPSAPASAEAAPPVSSLAQLSSTPGDSASRRPAAATPAPPTRIPPSETLLYRVYRGAISGDGKLEWHTDARQYRLQLEAQVPLLGTIFAQASQGGFDAAGLAPLRHTERRIGRSERALSFVHSTDGQDDHIAFSSQTGHAPLSAGTQDRVSWMVQLPALLEGAAAVQTGQQFVLQVASVQGEVQSWRFVVTETPAAGSTGLIKLVRQSDGLYDTRAEVWADPLHHHWLVHIRLQEARGDPLELVVLPF
ncbi:MAG: DUF3108 domain-containing protein [Leptothrix sp. (in: b-proteobacteria)]